ncbi:MAG: hypothetical protein ABIJ56_16670 [Pseudomonadota bacterium]
MPKDCMTGIGCSDAAFQEVMAEEEKVRERVDGKGGRWRKVYVGGGEHFKNWLEQCKELGEVKVEEVDMPGYKCFDQAGEKLFRIWVKIDGEKSSELF